MRKWPVKVAQIVFLTMLLLILRLWRRYGSAMSQQLADDRRRRRESEAAYFARFRQAALSGDRKATWNRWTSWLDRTHRGGGAATIRAFVEAAGDPDLESELDALDAGLFAPGHPESDPSTRVLYRKVARIRRRRQRSRPEQEIAAPLNPRRVV